MSESTKRIIFQDDAFPDSEVVYQVSSSASRPREISINDVTAPENPDKENPDPDKQDQAAPDQAAQEPAAPDQAAQEPAAPDQAAQEPAARTGAGVADEEAEVKSEK